MKIVRFEIDSTDHDLYLQHLESLVSKKRQILLKKQKQLGTLENHNIFLKEVRRDYIDYHNYIIKQKNDQIKALESLHRYIENLTKIGNLTFNNLKDAKYEQEKILAEINSIKRNLDAIIQDIGEVSVSPQNRKNISKMNE